VESAYNNTHRSSIRILLYEALNGRKCKTPLCCLEAGETKLTESKIVNIIKEKVKVIRANMKETQDMQRSYSNLKKMPFDMKKGDLMILKVSP